MKERFLYKGYARSYNILERINGIDRLPMYQPAALGAFSVLFYNSASIPGFYIPQDNLGVIYNHARIIEIDYKNRTTSSLLLPTPTKISQLDFYIQSEQLGLSPTSFLGCDPDNIDEIFKRVWHYKDNPKMALLYVNKIIEIICEQDREKQRLDEFIGIKKNIESSLHK